MNILDLFSDLNETENYTLSKEKIVMIVMM